MKESYYERLGVEKTADALQIKRAYYTLVKQYPPERFPEEYKRLREAYDTLSDESKRAKYDENSSLPKDVAYLFEQAEKLERKSHYAEATKAYELILKLHPRLTQARVALAKSYEQQQKNGKAISTWEMVCKEVPESAEYAHELALAYDTRGWTNKARAEYRRALELDDGNDEYWISLMNSFAEAGHWDEARDVCEQGSRTMKERGTESVVFYSFAVMLYVQNEDETETMERYLGDIVRIFRNGSDYNEHAQTVLFLLEIVKRLGKLHLVKYIREMAATLPYIDDELQKQLEEAGRAEEIDALTEQGFSDLFHDLFAVLLNDCDCEECKLELIAIECHLLDDIGVYRSELLRLQKEHPDLYALHSGFFNEVLRTRNPEKLLYKRLKILNKKGSEPVWNAEDEEPDFFAPVQTIRRTEPKVGRNDPCPCGSGKKYKNCCGR